MMLQPGSRPLPNSPDYRLIRKLGAGAFGEVWHASGPGGLDVALKFIRLDTQVRALELRSLDVMKSIRHPNLVSVFGAWHRDNWLILAMELCDRSLQDRLAEALHQNLPGIPPEELLRYMSDAANGLDALNARQVQHRDVKPANLLLLASGVKVADFGLAKALEHTVASNSGAGTLAYTAPECFKGKLTQQSDQYSLAVTYYHLRTGHLLFKGDQAQVMYAHLELEPDLSHLPRAEGVILSRALSKEAGKRWQNCREFVTELFAAMPAVLCEAALSSLVLGQLDEAIRLFDRVIRLNPKHSFAYSERAKAWFRKSKSGSDIEACDQAIQDFNEVIRLDPRDTSAYEHRGIAWYWKKDYEKAIKDFSEAIRLLSTAEGEDFDKETLRLELAEVYYCRGNTWACKGKYHKAIKDFEEAIRLDPNNALAYLHRGKAWVAKAYYDKAIQDFDLAIEIRKGLCENDLGASARNLIGSDALEAALYHHRGEAWAHKREYDNAIQDFDEAIRLTPNVAVYYFMRGQALSNKQAYVKAIQDYDEAIRLDPSEAVFFNNRGVARSDRQDYVKAIQDFDEAIRLDPSEAVFFYNHGIAWSGHENLDKAIENYSEAIRLDPSEADFYDSRAIAWSSKNDYDKAIQDYDAAIRLDPQRTRLYSARGWASYAKKDYDRAIKDFGHAIRQTKRRLEKLRVLNAPEIIIQNELRILNRLEDARRSAGLRPHHHSE